MSPKQVTATVLPANNVPQSITGRAAVASNLTSSSGQQKVPSYSFAATTESYKFVETAQQTDKTCGGTPSSSQPPPLIQTGGLDIADLAKAGQSVPSGRVSPAPTLTSGTHGILRSPGPTGPNAFMSVEDILVPPAVNQAMCKGTQTSSGNLHNIVQPSVSNNRPTMLTALLKSGTNAQPNLMQPQSSTTNVAPKTVVQSNAAQQQAMVSHLLHSLVNQSPVPTPATFKKLIQPTVSSKADPVVMATAIPASKVPPQQIQHTPMAVPRAVSLGNGFNPSVFLANPTQLPPQQVMTTGGAILSPNALLPNMPYLNPFSAIYGSGLVQAPSTCGAMDPSVVKNFGPIATTTLPMAVPTSRDTDMNKPSPPKKPRLG